jgi:hypothetical protein
VISQYYEYAGPTLHQLFVGDTSGLDPDPSKYSEPEVMCEALGLARRLPTAVPILWKVLRRLGCTRRCVGGQSGRNSLVLRSL